MPAAAVYVVAVIGAAAAGFAFKEFVYEPRIVPAFRQWKEDFRVRREAERRRRQGAAEVPGTPYTDEAPASRSDAPIAASSGVAGQDARWRQSVIELQNLAEREREQWADGGDDGLRHRRGPANKSDTSLPVDFVDQQTHVWNDGSSSSREMGSVSRSSSVTMPTPRAPSPAASDLYSPPTTISSVSRASSPDVVAVASSTPVTSPRSPPVAYTSPRSPFADPSGPAVDLSLSDWVPTSPGRSSAGSNLADSFAELDAPTPVAVAPPRSDAASPFVLASARRDSASGASEPEVAATDVSLDSDDDLSDLGSADGSDVSGWQSIGRSPQRH